MSLKEFIEEIANNSKCCPNNYTIDYINNEIICKKCGKVIADSEIIQFV